MARGSSLGRSRGRVGPAAAALVLVGSLVAVPASPGAAARTAATGPAAAARTITYFTTPTLDSRPFGITVGPDGNLWFTESNANRIGRITPDGVITEFRLGTGDKQPYGIVAGADGNLWFTERKNNRIGVMDTGGHLLHEYVAPGTDPLPSGITVAPNGDVWFTETGMGETITDDVGRVRPNGIVTTYRLFDCACFPIGIAVGADGNLWVAEELGVFDGAVPGTIDRVTPNGRRIDRFPLPLPADQPGHLPAFIAPGPDGNLWFTEFAADVHKLGRVTTDGTITEFPLPGDVTNSVGVTTGSDGNLWVTQGDAGDVLTVDTSGQVLHTYPTHPTPASITIGPDGNMWFASLLDGEIGRIEIAKPGVAYVLDIAPGFVPASRMVPLGTTVEWVLEAPGDHEVEDRSGLGLFDSGPQPPVSFLSHRFVDAGTYPFGDPVDGDRGRILVRPSAPAVGQVGTPFRVTWGIDAPAAGLVRDVQVLAPGGSGWQPWQTAVTTGHATYTPTAAGDWSFRARLREPGAAASDWSPVATVTVS
jgi:streptogramin lyase